jgi:hypothetical protein
MAFGGSCLNFPNKPRVRYAEMWTAPATVTSDYTPYSAVGVVAACARQLFFQQ